MKWCFRPRFCTVKATTDASQSSVLALFSVQSSLAHENIDIQWSVTQLMNCIFIVVPHRSLRITQPFPQQSVDPGQLISAMCQTDSANPTPIIQWKKNNGLIKSDNNSTTITTKEVLGDYNAYSSKSTLTITATTSGDQFTCTVFGTSQSTESTSYQLKCK